MTSSGGELIIYVGDKVTLEDGCLGIVRFIGELIDKNGIFYGVELESGGIGKNDGSLDGIYYFTVKSKTQPTGRLITKNKIIKSNRTTQSSKFTIGQKVGVKNFCLGIIKYVGIPSFANPKKIHYGIELDEPKGDMDGTKRGQKFFTCGGGNNYGVLINHDSHLSTIEDFQAGVKSPRKEDKNNIDVKPKRPSRDSQKLSGDLAVAAATAIATTTNTNTTAAKSDTNTNTTNTNTNTNTTARKSLKGSTIRTKPTTTTTTTSTTSKSKNEEAIKSKPLLTTSSQGSSSTVKLQKQAKGNDKGKTDSKQITMDISPKRSTTATTPKHELDTAKTKRASQTSLKAKTKIKPTTTTTTKETKSSVGSPNTQNSEEEARQDATTDVTDPNEADKGDADKSDANQQSEENKVEDEENKIENEENKMEDEENTNENQDNKIETEKTKIENEENTKIEKDEKEQEEQEEQQRQEEEKKGNIETNDKKENKSGGVDRINIQVEAERDENELTEEKRDQPRESVWTSPKLTSPDAESDFEYGIERQSENPVYDQTEIASFLAKRYKINSNNNNNNNKEENGGGEEEEDNTVEYIHPGILAEIFLAYKTGWNVERVQSSVNHIGKITSLICKELTENKSYEHLKIMKQGYGLQLKTKVVRV